MDINAMVGMVRAAVVTPADSVVITVDRYMTGPQLKEISKFLQKRLPGINVVTLGKGMSMEVVKADSAPASA